MIAQLMSSANGNSPGRIAVPDLRLPSTDNSSGALPVGFSSEPVGNTWRGLGSSWFNQNRVEAENFARNAQSQANEYYLNKDLMERQQQFQIDALKNQYQWAVEGMKAAGINPVMAFSNNASVSSPVSSSGASVGSGSWRGTDARQSDRAFLQLVGTVIQAAVAGSVSASNAKLFADSRVDAASIGRRGLRNR